MVEKLAVAEIEEGEGRREVIEGEVEGWNNFAVGAVVRAWIPYCSNDKRGEGRGEMIKR